MITSGTFIPLNIHMLIYSMTKTADFQKIFVFIVLKTNRATQFIFTFT